MTFSYKLGLGRFQEPGPGLMSFLASLFLLLISLLFLISLLSKRDVKCETTIEKGLLEKPNLGRIGFVIALLFAYALLLERLGYLVVTTLILSLLFRGVGTRWRVAVISSILSSLITYFIFTYLVATFPLGIFELLRF